MSPAYKPSPPLKNPKNLEKILDRREKVWYDAIAFQRQQVWRHVNPAEGGKCDLLYRAPMLCASGHFLWTPS